VRRAVTLLGFVALIVAGHGYAQQRPALSDAGESRIALVIGNAAYKDAPLANPVNDARAVARTLNELGFQVKVQTNLTQVQMRRAIREFGDELHARQGVGLFYFAGHGVQISNRNFLIPVGADIQREYEVEDQAVDAGAVLAMMQSAKARVNIVVLDACRNNPFIREFRSTINGLAPMQAPAGTILAFSTAPGQTAIDGTGQYGLYTEHLVEQLGVPGIKIEDVFKNVRIGVQRASGGRQVPWENTSLTGDFYFKAPAAVAAGSASGASSADVEKAVQAALRKRDEEEAARRQTQQSEIERAVLAALKKREEELARSKAAPAARETQAAQASVEELKWELNEVRAARRQETASAATAGPAGAASGPAGSPPQVALAVPAVPRTRPDVKVGGSVDRPEIRVGDRWHYEVTDGYSKLKKSLVMEVATVTGERIYTRTSASGGGSLVDVWDRNWNQLRHGENDLTPFYPSFQFPLEPGKNWSGSVKYVEGDVITESAKARVSGWERITVPAGTFDAVKVVLTGHFTGPPLGLGQTSTGSTERVVWYSPSVRQAVRMDIARRDFATTRALNLSERWELTEFHAP